MWKAHPHPGADAPVPLPQSGRGGQTPRRKRVLRRESSVEIQELAQVLREVGNSAEDALWRVFRNRRFLGLKFRRQHPLGRFIADFYCFDRMTVIEVDGGVHSTEEAQHHDRDRDRWMAERGIRVIRLDADQVLRQPKRVLTHLAEVLQQPLPALDVQLESPLPLRGRGTGAQRQGEGARPRPSRD